jgi:3-deoxy-D-manno-octulosonate 8-phosphate phosphatase KdsC-like HAD superfamily phosphatase
VFDAAHVQSRVALTVSVPVPPDAGTVSTELVTVTPQRGGVGAVTEVFDEVHDAIETASSRRRA